jgi:hypothetical protein
MLNPYAQGGWANPQNPHSINNGTWGSHSPPQPSLYGALPRSGPPFQPMIITFLFTSLDPTILDCKFVGPDNRTYFVISTSPNIGASTVIHDYRGKQVAAVEWDQQPIVQVHDVVRKQAASRWIKLAPDQRYVALCTDRSTRTLVSYRTMEVKGKWYAWMPSKDGISVSSIVCSRRVAANQVLVD